MKLKSFKLFLEQRGASQPNVIEVSTGILGIIDTNLLSPEVQFSSTDDEPEGYYVDGFWSGFKNQEYLLDQYNFLVPFLQPRLDEAIVGLGIGIEEIRFKSFAINGSEHHWGFNMLLDFVVEDDYLDTIKDYIGSIKPKDMDFYFRDNWGHRDGFASYMPQTKEHLIEFLESDDERKVERGLCSFLLFVIGDEKIAQWNEELEAAIPELDPDNYYDGEYGDPEEESDDDDDDY